MVVNSLFIVFAKNRTYFRHCQRRPRGGANVGRVSGPLPRLAHFSSFSRPSLNDVGSHGGIWGEGAHFSPRLPP